MSDHEKALLAADIVMFSPDGGEVLLIKRRWNPFKDWWALPGGHVDTNETFIEAAVREAREETGIDVSLTQVGVYDTPDRDPRGRVISVAYVCTVPRDVRAIAGDDAREVAWIPFSSTIALAFDHQRIIRDAWAVWPGYEEK